MRQSPLSKYNYNIARLSDQTLNLIVRDKQLRSNMENVNECQIGNHDYMADCRVSGFFILLTYFLKLKTSVV